MKKLTNSGDTRRNRILSGIICTMLMIVLGMSDSLRGVFSPVFKDELSLSGTQVSMIISISYLGNFIFLFLGGKLLDTFNKKKVMMATLLTWMASLLLYFFTKSYYVLLLGMIFSMGASTLLSTSVNLITPILFLSPGLMVNIFNFSQGLGISGTQNLVAAVADGFSSWQLINLMMFFVGIVIFVLMFFLKIPETKNDDKEKTTYMSIVKNPAFIYLMLMCGCYYIPEHGLLNWLPTYASEHLGYTVSQGSVFIGIFFGLITIGRLAFAFIVNKLGAKKSLIIFTAFYSVLYIIGIILGKSGIFVLCASGLGCSIIWPTFVYFIQLYYPQQSRGKAVGLVTGLSTVFDIGFNALFGPLTEKVGFGVSIYILPIAIAVFALSFALLLIRVPKSREI